MTTRARTIIVGSGPYLIIVASLALQAGLEFAPFDDAYITFRYARNIANGLGFVYNSGERVLGTTTPVFAILLAVPSRLLGTDSVLPAANLISLLADLVSSILMYRLGKRAFSSHVVGLGLALAFALNPFRITVAKGGMEASLLTVSVLLSFEHLVLRKSVYWGALFGAACLMIRPDSALLLTPIFAYLVLRDRKLGIQAATVTGLLLVPWLIWSTSYFGSAMPNSVIAKSRAYTFPSGFAACFIVAFLGTGVVTPCWQLPVFAVVPASILITAIVIGIIHAARRNADFAPLILTGPFFLTVLAFVNAPMFFPWYFYPVIPSVIFALAACIWFLPVESEKIRSALISLVLLVSIALPGLYLSRLSPWPTSREREAAYLDLCPMLQQEVRPGDIVLAPDIGIIGWCLPNTEIIDPIGLVSPAAIPFLSVPPEQRVISPALIEAYQPDFVVTLDQYLAPLWVPPSKFSDQYSEFRSVVLSISGDVHTLYVFRRTGS